MRQRCGWQITDILRSWRRFTKQEPKQCENKRPFPKNVILLSWPNFLTDSDSCFDTRWHHSFSFLPPHLIPSHPFPFLSYFQDVFILMNVFTPRSPKRACLVYRVMLRSYVLFLSPHFIQQPHKPWGSSQGRSSSLAPNSQHTSCSATLNIQFETVTKKERPPSRFITSSCIGQSPSKKQMASFQSGILQTSHILCWVTLKFFMIQMTWNNL